MSEIKIIKEIEVIVEKFITENRKICWEAEFEKGEYCIGENNVRKLIGKLICRNMFNNG